MIPDAYVAPLISLGLGAAGTLTGLFIGFAPTPEQAALQGARAASSTELREGDLVLLEGTLGCGDPLDGPISGHAVAVQRLSRSELGSDNPYVRNRNERERENASELQSARGLCVIDANGRVYLDVLEGVLLLTTQRHTGTESSMGERWSALTTPETRRLYEYSIPVGAPVVAVGRATWDGKAWALRGRDFLLTDVTRAELESGVKLARLGGTALIVASLVSSLGYALVSLWG